MSETPKCFNISSEQNESMETDNLCDDFYNEHAAIGTCEELSIKSEEAIKDNIFNIELNSKTNNQECEKEDSANICDGLNEDTETNDENKIKRLQIETDTESMVYHTEFDAFSDNKTVYRKYNLRKKPKLSLSQNEESEKIEALSVKKAQIKNKEDHICSHCYTSFENKKGLSMHMKSHKQITTYICSQCSDKFDSNAQLISHKKVHAEEEKSFTCKPCKLAFSDHCDYVLHEIHHNKKDKYHCKECGVTFTSKFSFQIHVETHYDRTVKCDICSKMVKRYIFQKHLRDHKSSLIECCECGKMFKEKKYFNYHMSSHTGVKPYQCLYCGKGFLNNNQRRVHTRIHTGERPFECKICFQKFKQVTDLNRHTVTHDAIKRHQCKVCGRKFFHKYYMESVHMLQHTNKMKYKCVECGKRYPNSRGLQTHILYCHTDITEKSFECKPCKKSFFSKSDYNRHCKSKQHKNNMYGEMLKEIKKQDK